MAQSVVLVAPQYKEPLKVIQHEIEKNIPNIDVSTFVIGQSTELTFNDHILVTLGVSTLRYVSESGYAGPVISSYLSKISEQRLQQESTLSPSIQRVALYTEPSINSQMSLISKLYPRNPYIAVFLSDQSGFLQTEIESAAKVHNISVNIQQVISAREIYASLSQNRYSAILAIPDDTIYNRNTIRAILEVSYAENTAIVGYSPSLVQAGAIATTYTDEVAVAKAISDEIRSYQERGRFGPSRQIESRSVEINPHVANSLNILIEPKHLIEQSLRDVN